MKSINALISAKNISVIKNQKSILKNIDIQINKNDFVSIIGPNGAGKTMLLKCLMGFYKPEFGAKPGKSLSENSGCSVSIPLSRTATIMSLPFDMFHASLIWTSAPGVPLN